MHRLLMALAGVVIPTSTASASLLLYEPFDYADGADLGVQTAPNGQDWAVTGTGDQILVSTPGMTVPGLVPSSGGNAVTFGGAGQTDRVAISPDGTPVAAGTVYYSLVFRVNDMTGLAAHNGTGAFFAGFNNVAGTQAGQPSSIAARLRLQTDDGDATKFEIGIENYTGGAVFKDDPYAPQTDIFVVAAWDLDNNLSHVWINPSSSDFGAAIAPAPDLTASGPNLPGEDEAETFVLRQNGVFASSATVDELRVGTDWASVTPVPEPVALSAFGLAAVGMLARRRRA